jgi:hypothetical protein
VVAAVVLVVGLNMVAMVAMVARQMGKADK